MSCSFTTHPTTHPNGVDMHPLVFFSFMIYLGAFVLIQQVMARRYGCRLPDRKIESMPLILARIVGSCFMLATVLTIDKAETITYPMVRIFGVVVVLFGLYVSMRAQQELGRNWIGGIGLHKGHKLITTGPYRFVRHPLYAGMIISSFGFALVSLNVLYFLMCLFSNGAFALRAPIEEIMLQQKFKKKYDAYIATTGMLIPKFGKRG